jgi:hypothetical protein
MMPALQASQWQAAWRASGVGDRSAGILRARTLAIGATPSRSGSAAARRCSAMRSTGGARQAGAMRAAPGWPIAPSTAASGAAQPTMPPWATIISIVAALKAGK